MKLREIIHQDSFTREEIIFMLESTGEESQLLYDTAREVKYRHVGNKVWFRGLIEYSNKCSKNCYYCGIRAGNFNQVRYEMTDQEVIDSAMYAYKNDFASIVIQSGERSDRKFTEKIEHLLKEISERTKKELHITLSLGEQDEETYRKWLEAGAQRYLLRIETSNPGLYKKLHPGDNHHRFETRIGNLKMLRKTGYMVGTGVMIGLPFQTMDDLAGDLIFMRDFDVDMVGMGPYIEHRETPLYEFRDQLLPLQERLELSLKMVAILRIMMKDINIAATTAMQTIDPRGREKALRAGANVMMPNITPLKYKQGYLLYNNKPGTEDDAEEGKAIMEKNISDAGEIIGYGEWGDPRHFERITKKK